MKLYFEIRKLVENVDSQRQLGKDNIPMINKKGKIWFLWDKSLLKSDALILSMSNIYKLKKIG